MRPNTDNPIAETRFHALLIPGIFVLLVGAASAAGTFSPDALDYQRLAILEGHQWWRLLSAHLVHLNAWHAAMNIAALALVLLIVGDGLGVRGWIIAYAVISAGISAAMLVTLPDLLRYAGASGVIHGLLACGALLRARRHRIESSVILLGLALKLAYEALFGASPASSRMIGAEVITEAHLCGALMGGIVAVATLAARRAFADAGEL